MRGCGRKASHCTVFTRILRIIMHLTAFTRLTGVTRGPYKGFNPVRTAMTEETLFLDFTTKSPRGYRGQVAYSGHNGARSKNGTWAPNKVDRKRWTTALTPAALDSLHALAKKYGLNRCEVAEILLLHPDADQIIGKALAERKAS